MTSVQAPLAQVIAERTQKTDTCWLWIGSVNSTTGYGRISRGAGKHIPAHRAAYELARGPIPEGLVIDHLCRVRHCVNPSHLEPVTPRENTLRGVGITAQNARADHCKRGHRLNEANIFMQRGQRLCRTCYDARNEHHNTKRSARRAARREAGLTRHVLNEDLVREIRRLRAEGLTRKAIQERLGLPVGAVAAVVQGKAWRHVSDAA